MKMREIITTTRFCTACDVDDHERTPDLSFGDSAIEWHTVKTKRMAECETCGGMGWVRYFSVNPRTNENAGTFWAAVFAAVAALALVAGRV